jgi:hypothetical protein
MSRNDKKIPKNAVNRPNEKIVRSSSMQLDPKPAWRFSTVDLAGPFSWPKGKDEEADIVAKLHCFDSMRWLDIEGDDHHFLDSQSLSKAALARLKEIGRDDEVDSLFSFHLQGKPRIICIRDRNLAKLLWFDPDHGVSPSHKR